MVTEKSESRLKLESWLNQTMRIKMTDGRTLIGSFLCTDKDRNVILGSCEEYVKAQGEWVLNNCLCNQENDN